MIFQFSLHGFWYCFFAVVGILIVGSNFGSFITSLYCLGLVLGTIYSVPPFRIKRLPVAAFLIIATVRGFLLNLGYNLKLEVERLKKEKKLSFALSPESFFFTKISSHLSHTYTTLQPPNPFFLTFSSTLSYACSHMFCSQTYLICGDHMFCSQIS